MLWISKKSVCLLNPPEKFLFDLLDTYYLFIHNTLDLQYILYKYISVELTSTFQFLGWSYKSVT